MKPASLGLRPGLVVTMALVTALSWSCGKKTPPRPPRRPSLPRIQDLKARPEQSGIRLSWSMPAAAASVAGFNLYRSRPQGKERQCPGCPRAYELIGTLAVRPGQLHFQSLDRGRDIKGTVYYRVVPYDRRNRLGPDSNEATAMVR